MTQGRVDDLLGQVASAPPQSPVAPAAPPAPAREARWIPTLGVLLVILFVTLGGFLLGEGRGAVGEAGETTLGRPIDVSDEVRFRPATGWTVNLQNADPPQVRLTADIGALYVIAAGAAAGPAGLLEEYLAEVVEPQASQLSVSEPEAVTIPGTGSAVRVTYVGLFEGAGTPLEGEVVAGASPQGNGVVLDGWAPEGQYVVVRSDVRAMVRSAEVA